MVSPLRRRHSLPPFTLADLGVTIAIPTVELTRRRSDLRIVPSKELVAEEVALIEGIPLILSFQRRNVGLAEVLGGPHLPKSGP